MLQFQVGHYIYWKDIPIKEKKDNMLMSFMFIKHKTKPDGTYERTKARMVLNGKQQKEHMYDITVGLEIVFFLMNIASCHRVPLITYDVKGAFLNAHFNDQDPKHYTRIPSDIATMWVKVDDSAKPYLTAKGELILCLDKCVYGLKQAPVKWQDNLHKTLIGLKYEQQVNDPCLYIRKGRVFKDGTIQNLQSNSVNSSSQDHVFIDASSTARVQPSDTGFIYLPSETIPDYINPLYSQNLDDSIHFSTISTHVEDILQVSSHEALTNELKIGLTLKYGSITYTPKADAYLGMSINQSVDNHEIQLSPTGLLDKLVEQYLTQKDKIRTVQTPADVNLFLSSGLNANKESHFINNEKNFLSLIMSLMYLARLTRPDILLVTTWLATKTHQVTNKEIHDAKRILQYLFFTREKTLHIKCSGFKIYLMCDASYTDSKSHTGYILSLSATCFNSAMEVTSYVHSRSGKQKLTTTSSTEAEIIAVCENALYLRSVISDLGITTLETIELYQDNKIAIGILNGTAQFKKSKHIATKLAFIKEIVKDGILDIK